MSLPTFSGKERQYDVEYKELCEKKKNIEARRRADYNKQIIEYEEQVKEYEEKSQADALQRKRDRNRAASARYYAKHPEIREKKRRQMAEARDEQQLGDFPSDLDLDLDADADPPRLFLSHDELLEQFMATMGEVPPTREEDAVQSLLQLQSTGNQYVFPPDLPPSDDPGTSEDEACPVFENTLTNKWVLIAPDYSSSESGEEQDTTN
ncbi:hypothetical protein FB451DRAFT_1408916 [Mycena latifolia]|nr:hypothetical protein FB451DRAFT_1408916 [Mycena latifolia]